MPGLGSVSSKLAVEANGSGAMISCMDEAGRGCRRDHAYLSACMQYDDNGGSNLHKRSELGVQALAERWLGLEASPQPWSGLLKPQLPPNAHPHAHRAQAAQAHNTALAAPGPP